MKRIAKFMFSSMILWNFLFLGTAFAQTESANSSDSPGKCGSFRNRHCPPSESLIEPNAGNWRTWVISSGKDYRVPPPPGRRQTRAELRQLADLISDNDAQAQQQIAFWDAGPPVYRWIDLITSRLMAGTPTTAFPHRVYTYVALAISRLSLF